MDISFLILSVLLVLGFSFGYLGATGQYLQITTRARILVFAAICFLLSGGIILDKLIDPLAEEIISVRSYEFPSPKTYTRPSTGLPPKTNDLAEYKKVALDSKASTAPVVWKDLLIFGTEESVIYALSRANGQPVWSLKVQNPLSVLSLNREDGRLFAGEKEGTGGPSSFFCIEAQTGKVLWQIKLPAGVKTPASFDKEADLVIFGLTNGETVAVVYATGVKHWATKTGPDLAGAFFFSGRVFILTNRADLLQKSALRTLVTSNSREYWHSFFEGVPIDIIPLEEKTEAVIILTKDFAPGKNGDQKKSWAQLILGNGNISWKTEVPPDTLPSLLYVSRNRVLVFTTRSGALIALSVLNGKKIWSTEIGKEMAGKPVLFFPLSNPLIATVSGDGIFSLHRAADGKEIVRRTVEPGASVAPIMTEDLAYILTPNHLHIFSGLISFIGKPDFRPTKMPGQAPLKR